MIFASSPTVSAAAIIQTALQLAIEHYSAARYAEAEAVCRQILERAASRKLRRSS